MKYTKVCPKCKLEKTLDSYYRHKSGKIYSYCKVCESDRHKSYRYKVYNKNKASKYYEKNKDQILRSNREWMKNNKIHWNNYMKLYRLRSKTC